MTPSTAASILALGTVGCLLAQAPQFELATPTAIHARQFARTVTADIDGDGDQDVIGWEVLTVLPQPTLLRNDGDGVFTDISVASLPTGLGIVLQVVPFDADGDLDLDLFVSGNLQSAVLRNNGAGAFTVQQILPQPLAYFSGATAGDLDGDGDVDLAVSGSVLGASMHQVLVNNGHGTLTPGPQFGSSLGGDVAALDVDGDNDLDLLYFAPPLRLWRNDGNLQFTDVSATQLQATGTFYRIGGVADLDGDGDPDVVLLGTTTDTILINTQGVLVEAALPPAAFATDSLVVGDVDRDGRPDVLRGNDQSGLELLHNQGGMVFVSNPARLPTTPIASTFVQLADFDRDGDPEILSCLALSATLVLANRDLDLAADPAAIGQPWLLQVASRPGYATMPQLARLAVALAPIWPPLPIPQFGELQIDTAAVVLLLDTVVSAPGGRANVALPVPNAPVLIGLDLYTQALVETASGPRLTNRRVTTIG